MRASLKLVAQCGDKFERRLLVGMQRRLTLHPRLGVREWLEDATASTYSAVDETPVHQKQEDDRTLIQWHRGPIVGNREIVLEV
jgi:hypothetical protein